MDSLFLSYLIVSIASLICVFIGSNLFHPKNSMFIILFYLGFVVFFIGRFYELSRIVLNLDIYNEFELGFLGIIGTLSFWLSANFEVKHEVEFKYKKSIIVKSLLFAFVTGLMYLIILSGEVNTLEKIIDFIITIFVCSNIYYYMRHLLMIKTDRTCFLKNLKIYNILGIIFSILIMLLAISFAHNLYTLILIDSILISIVLLIMMVEFKKVAKKWK